MVRENVPGNGSQFRVWMNCAALTAYLLGRNYWSWTPHGLYVRLRRDPSVQVVDLPAFLSKDLLKHPETKESLINILKTFGSEQVS